MALLLLVLLLELCFRAPALNGLSGSWILFPQDVEHCALHDTAIQILAEQMMYLGRPEGGEVEVLTT